MKQYFLVCTLIVCSTGLFGQSNGKISGYMFGDYFYNIFRDNNIDSLGNVILPGKKDFNGFQFRRIYFTYDYKISETFDTRFRIEADQLANTSNGKIGVALKDAYLKWKNIFDGSDIILGLQPQPAFEISEAIWGFRSLEKTILDLRGIVPSRDLGISLKGMFDNSGNINYWVMIGNNSGNSPEIDKYKRFYGHLYFKPLTNFYVTVYGDLKIRPSLKVNSVTLNNNDITTALFAGYSEKDIFSVGVESFLQIRENGFFEQGATSLIYQTKNALGISAFGSYNFSSMIGAVVRFDHFDPNIDSDFKGDSRNFYILSLVFKPEAAVSIMPNLLYETYESTNGNNYDASVTGRITFYYSFL
ncbi:MAG: hypothetical protein A2V93_03390 [Ignavibacteria bacterium RBG_16_34_14]|nr:MAG: hypothetical protein A2V93_03390 [Ignavibacteria bacterium RBG_16_34_14]